MATLHETRTGAQILPDIHDERATVPSWAAHCACDADLRTKSAAHRALAETLEVRTTA